MNHFAEVLFGFALFFIGLWAGITLSQHPHYEMVASGLVTCELVEKENKSIKWECVK